MLPALVRRLQLNASHIAVSVVAAAGALSSVAQAAEGGATVYLLGSGGPGAAVMPPVEGVFFDNTLYFYDGSAGGERQFTLGGKVVAGLDATIVANFDTFLWVPSTDFAGGTLGLALVIPFGAPQVDVSAVLTGPLGNTVSVNQSDTAFVIGDPVISAMLGWTDGNWHTQISTLVNIPVGEYREDALANLAFHRWAADLSLALSWHDPKAGWDVSGKVGVTFNGTNDATDYTSGTDFHAELAIERMFSPAFSFGAQAYYYQQISDDSGSGAVLGANRGEVTGLGLTAAYNFEVSHNPLTLRGRVMWEMNAERRLEGTAAFLSLSFPLQMNLPGAPE